MPTPPPKPTPHKKMWWMILGATGLFGLCCIGSFLITRDNSHPSLPLDNAANAGKIGTAVRDGKVEFVVRSVQCGVDQIGPDDVYERAQGQFCLVSLTVKNIGDQPLTLPDGVQKGYGTDGAQYAINSAAGLYANESPSQAWQNEINPGGEVTGTIVYDLPSGVELAQLELHDSPTSDGVRVDLR
jgi:hypothetical protein